MRFNTNPAQYSAEQLERQEGRSKYNLQMNIEGVQQPACLAVINDDLEGLENCLNSIHVCDDIHGATPLMYAAFTDNIRIAKKLLENGANVAAQNNYGESTLMCVLIHGSRDLFDLLLEQKDIKTSVQQLMTKADGSYGPYTPLMIAVENNEVDVVRALLKYKPDIHILNSNNESAMELADIWRTEDALRDVLDRFHTDQVTNLGRLFTAIEAGNDAHVRGYLNEGWKADSIHIDTESDKRFRSPLCFASQKGDKKIVELLLEAGAQPWMVDYDFVERKLHSSIFYAIQYEHINVLDLLLEKSDNTIVDRSLPTNDEALGDLKPWIGHNCLIKSTDIRTPTLHNYPLTFAASIPSALSINILCCKHRANRAIKDNSGKTALNLLNLLPESECRSSSEPPYHFAIDTLKPETRPILPMDSYVVDMPCIEEKTCRAVVDGNSELLTTYVGADPGQVNVKVEDDFTPLLCAAYTGNNSIVDTLIELGADVNALNKYNESSLFIAISRGYHAIANKLLECGKDLKKSINALTRIKQTNYTVLMVAIESGFDVDPILKYKPDIHINFLGKYNDVVCALVLAYTLLLW